MKKEKSPKIPSRFRKTLKSRQFRQKILRRIHIPKEQDFITSLFREEEPGRFVPDLKKMGDKRTIDHLKKLDKAIRKNRGVLTGWKVAIIAVPAAAFGIFNTLFLDSMAERQAEKALEAVFQARVDIRELDIALFEGKVSFAQLSVADKSEALRNSIEMDHTELSFNLPALLKKQLVIETMESRRIRFGTPRQSSGLLERRQDPEKQEEADNRRTDMAQEVLDSAASLAPDPQELLQRYGEELKSPELINRINREISAIPRKWEDQLVSYQSRWEGLESKARSFLARDPRSLGSAEEVLRYIEDAKTIKTETIAFRGAVEGDITELESDMAKASAYQEELSETINGDLAFIETIPASISDVSGEIVSGRIRSILRERLGSLAGIAEKTWTYLRDARSGFSPVKEENPEKSSFADRRGERILFPGTSYPPFLLKSLVAEFGNPGEEGYNFFSINDLALGGSGWIRPLAIRYLARPSSLSAEAEVLIEQSGQSGTERSYLTLALEGIPLELNNPGIPGIDALSGTGTLRFEGALDRELTGAMSGDLLIDHTEYQFTDEAGLIPRAVQSVFAELQVIDLGTDLLLEKGELSGITIQTDLDKRIVGALSRFGIQEAERIAGEYTDTFLAALSTDRQTFQSTVEEIERTGRELANQESRARLIEEKLSAAEAEGRRQIESLTDKAKQELQGRVEEEGAKVLKSLGGALGF